MMNDFIEWLFFSLILGFFIAAAYSLVRLFA
jgi:hypothetical protein